MSWSRMLENVGLLLFFNNWEFTQIVSNLKDEKQ